MKYLLLLIAVFAVGCATPKPEAAHPLYGTPKPEVKDLLNPTEQEVQKLILWDRINEK